MNEKRADTRLLTMRVTEGDYGKSEFIAFLTDDDLFDTRRPKDESIAAFAEALAATLGGTAGEHHRLCLPHP